jgi:hypothetical protein
LPVHSAALSAHVETSEDAPVKHQAIGTGAQTIGDIAKLLRNREAPLRPRIHLTPPVVVD